MPKEPFCLVFLIQLDSVVKFIRSQSLPDSTGGDLQIAPHSDELGRSPQMSQPQDPERREWFSQNSTSPWSVLGF